MIKEIKILTRCLPGKPNITIAVPVGPKYEEKVKPVASINAMSNGLYSQLISNIARINLTKIKAKKYIVVVKNTFLLESLK